MRHTTQWYTVRIDKDDQTMYQARRAHWDDDNALATKIEKSGGHYRNKELCDRLVAELNKQSN